MRDFYAQLVEKITTDTAHIVVMGLGYVGLPLATEFAKAGFRVTGYDPDEGKIASILRGESYVDYPSSEVLSYLVQEGFTATSSDTCLAEADVVIICVPTPLSKAREPDLSYVLSAFQRVSKHRHAGMLVVLESTTYPGTTREFLPSLLGEEHTLGESIFVAYSPERIDPGNKTYTLTNTPKVVAGATPNCSRLVQRLYFKINEQVVPVTSLETAEMTKLVENTFRAVNIALANEMAQNCRKLGIDPFEVVEAAATKPYGFMPFYPGLGVGGHCIPLDPQYLAWKLKQYQGRSRFIDLAEEINGEMPRYAAGLAAEALNSHGKAVRGAKILIMGVAYKADVGDLRESPVLTLIEHLLAWQGSISWEDPYVATVPLQAIRVEAPNYGDYDLVIIATPHSCFSWPDVRTQARLCLDTRGVLKDQYKKPVVDPNTWKL